MLRRQYRLKDRRVFKNIYRYGRQARSQDLAVFNQPNRAAVSRLAVVVSTKVSKKATVRNRIRRRLNAIMQANWAQLRPGQDILVLVKTDISSMPRPQLEAQLQMALSKLDLLEPKAKL